MVLSARFEFGLALARPHPGRPPLWLGKATDDEAGGAPMADGKGGAEATEATTAMCTEAVPYHISLAS